MTPSEFNQRIHWNGKAGSKRQLHEVIAYLREENWILKAQHNQRVRLTEAERCLSVFGGVRSRRILEHHDQ